MRWLFIDTSSFRLKLFDWPKAQRKSITIFIFCLHSTDSRVDCLDNFCQSNADEDNYKNVIGRTSLSRASFIVLRQREGREREREFAIIEISARNNDTLHKVMDMSGS